MGRRVSDAQSVKVVVPINTSITAGDFVFLGGFLGLALQSVVTDAVKTGEVVLDVTPGEYETKQINAADAFAVGDQVYWDNVNKRFTIVAAGNRYVGVVTQAKDANGVIWFRMDKQPGPIVQAAAQANSAAADVGGVVADFNNLLAKLRAAGIMAQ